MTYRYKGRGMVQLTGNQKMTTTPIPSITISGLKNGISSWPSSSATTQTTATIGKISGGYTTQGLFADVFASKQESHYKRYEVYEFQEDILAISCAWKRQRDTNPSDFRYSKLTDRALFETVTNQDKEYATTIRDYYSKKIMMLNLKGDNLTSFRKALNSFVHGSETKVIEELFPVIYRLPEFYEYDMDIENIKLILQDRPRGVKLEKLHGKQSVVELTPIDSVKKQNKRIKAIEYWFSDKDNIPFLIQLEPKNPLLHIWDEIFNSKKVLQISGMPFIKHMDDFEYLSIKNFKLAKI